MVHVDSSGYAYSGILSQKAADGKLHPVAYFSRKLTPTESKWQVHDQELGAIVACFEEWRSWLTGTQVATSVFSDHLNLRYFMSAQAWTAKQARWASFPSEFTFDILHIPGKLHPLDPALRRPDYATGSQFTDCVTLLGRREQDKTCINDVHLQKLKISRICDPLSSFMPPEETTLTALQALYESDALLGGKLPTALNFHDLLWWWKDKIYVPESMQNMILEQIHATPSGGHWGSMKTLDLLTRTFEWQNSRRDVPQFCSLCRSCQSIKVDCRPPQGKMMPSPIPDKPWSVIGVDFIVKLPVLQGFDLVMVVVNHYEKMLHFIPAKETWLAKDLANAFVTHIFRLHELPERIVSDRATTFMSLFWSSVLTQLFINPAPSTSFHPQTDGQVERINVLLEDYLFRFW